MALDDPRGQCTTLPQGFGANVGKNNAINHPWLGMLVSWCINVYTTYLYLARVFWGMVYDIVLPTVHADDLLLTLPASWKVLRNNRIGIGQELATQTQVPSQNHGPAIWMSYAKTKTIRLVGSLVNQFLSLSVRWPCLWSYVLYVL